MRGVRGGAHRMAQAKGRLHILIQLEADPQLRNPAGEFDFLCASFVSAPSLCHRTRHAA